MSILLKVPCDMRSKKYKENHTNLDVSGERTINCYNTQSCWFYKHVVKTSSFQASICCPPMVMHRIDSTFVDMYDIGNVLDICMRVNLTRYVHRCWYSSSRCDRAIAHRTGGHSKDMRDLYYRLALA